MNINLFNPVYDGVYITLLLSYLLGIVHGITPDEHTWPITFSYAVGSGSTKKGAEVGAIFSAGFTLQRALMSEIIFLAFAYGLASFRFCIASPLFFGIVYTIVGAVMYIAGQYVKYGSFYPHLEVNEWISKGLKKRFRHSDKDFYKKDVKPWMALIHGLIAGFGFGAFALIIYFVFVPNMPNAYVAFLPGLMFGLGTMTMQFAFGALFGTWIKKIKKISMNGLQFIARYISSSVLLYGGATFVIAGIGVILFPQILTFGVITPLQIHNLHDLGLGFFVVISVVVIIGLVSYRNAMKIALKKYSRH
ncbi:MAG: membrane protein [Candidatus Parvarchaeum acidophilus ARMAN-5]|uniref:Membrane protein n=1 Tax=Candidatus Parvarchaeum acidophilus ARMAN-5 TaxID=662762 RepID=D6GWK5_PARA5|nr:MAG: membrane protein [Candidatus Parvarchaeum acidophilus ARMAN-5]